jgi:hypothetical protein
VVFGGGGKVGGYYSGQMFALLGAQVGEQRVEADGQRYQAAAGGESGAHACRGPSAAVVTSLRPAAAERVSIQPMPSGLVIAVAW